MPVESGGQDAISALANNLANLKYEDIPSQAAELTKMSILDTLGVSIAASGAAPVCRKMADLVKEMGGKEESSIICFGGKVPSPMAAFVNAALAWALNYADVNHALGVHLGYAVFPAALAIAERLGKVAGKEFITAYTLAMDLECRLVRAIVSVEKPRDWLVYGWLPGQVFGYFGATAAAGRLLGLDEDQLVSAFGLAYCQVAGNSQPLVGGGADKGIYPAYPAKAGVLSALMAEKGIAGPKESLEGKAGLYNVYFQGEYNPAPLTAELGKSFEGTGFNRFPCVGHIRPYIELMLRMVDDNQIRPQDVEAITAWVGLKGQRTCEPLEIRRNPRNMSEAQYSLPFVLATVIAKGKPRIAHFTADGIRDREVLRLSNKVSYQVDQELDKRTRTDPHPVRVEVKLRDGRTLRSEQGGFRQDHQQGTLSKEELIEKFRDCVGHSLRPLPGRTVEELLEMVNNLEEVDDVSQIARLVS